MELYEEKYKLRCKELTEQDLALEELNNYENFKDILSDSEFNQVILNKQRRKNKRNRTKKKCLTMYKYALIINQPDHQKIVFGSIQPNDEMLAQKEDTYIRKIERWLKNHFVYSIMNKDFGSKTEREHYHFIGLTYEEIEQQYHEDGTPKKSTKGYDIYELKNKDFAEISKSKTLQFEPTLCLVNYKVADIEKTVDYLLKLNNHSNKLGTKNRVRVLKNHKAEMIDLIYDIDGTHKGKKAKLIYNRINKNPSYDTLNKRSVSKKRPIRQLSDEEFVNFLDGKIKYSEL